MDFSKICRICLKENQEITFDIFTSFYSKRNALYCDIISSCTKIKPNQEDGLPRLICKDCCRQLKKAYTFNLQCEDSDVKLKQYLQNLENSVKHEDEENISVKDEFEATVENNYDETSFEALVKNEELTSSSNVKEEPFINGDDSSWDADEDNLLLAELRSKKIEGVPEAEPEDQQKPEQEKHKNKNTRKKKVTQVENQSTLNLLPHQCDVCGKLLSTKSNLKAHKVCHTDLRPYECADCDATFKGHSALFQHRKIHTGETPYHCTFCPKKFMRRTGLINHLRTHTKEKLYRCDICLKDFIQSAQLSIHMKRHKGDKPYLCQVCGKGFPIKADLRVHQRIHNGEKPYACHLCTKTFATSGNLSIHIRIHNKEVRYQCKYCNRGFVTCSSYNVHVKRHKGQKDYHCECGKTFYTSSALKQHKVVHTGEKKYQCKLCLRKFSQTSHLTRHFKRDHVKNGVASSTEQYKVIVSDDNERRVPYNFDVQNKYFNLGVKNSENVL